MTARARSRIPGRARPTASARVDSDGLAIAVHEWGDEAAPPLLLAHGGLDFARTFDVFAPLLADAGWRVVSWDHRGHGDSEHAAALQLGGRPPRRGRGVRLGHGRRRRRSSATPRAAA